jgi:5-methyltetrahydropteroyltriglutamate--homocysteine methyltransferase
MSDVTVAKPVYRADVVGSMLRSPAFIEVKKRFRDGSLGEDRYRAAEDRAVDEALRIQEEAGLDVATDGEMRRDIFFDFLIAGVEGLEHREGSLVHFHSDEQDDVFVVPIPFVAVERLRAKAFPGLAEYRYASERSALPIKIALPSPTLALQFWTKEVSAEVYPDPFELVADAAAIVKVWVRELAEAGCPYVQIDAPELSQVYADERVRREYDERGISSERYKSEGAELVNELVAQDLPDSTTLGLHVCKGNGTQSWIAAGGYEDLARDVFRDASGFDVFHLEFDDERSGSFEPLRHLPEEKMAVLGLISTKWTKLEDQGELERRIAEAAEFHPLDRLAVATQCGFASAAETAEERKVTEQTQVDKLRLVADTARSVWGES